jgi:hypothetical protein
VLFLLSTATRYKYCGRVASIPQEEAEPGAFGGWWSRIWRWWRLLSHGRHVLILQGRPKSGVGGLWPPELYTIVNTCFANAEPLCTPI